MNDWLLPVAAGSNQWQPVAVSQPLVINLPNKPLLTSHF